MSKKADFKHEMKQPDTFVATSHIVLKFIEDHAKLVGAIAAAGVIGGVSYAGWNYWRAKVEASATDSLYKFEAQLKKAEGEIRDERSKKMQELAKGGAKNKEPSPEELRPVDYAKDFAALVSSLKGEIKRVSGTRAAMVSALNLSSFLVHQKQYADALEVLKISTFTPRSGDLLAGFWNMHYGLVLLENNKTDEAIHLYGEVLGDPALKPFHPEAMLKTGIAFELKGDLAKARDTYEKLGRDFPNTEASASATQYIRLLELKAAPASKAKS